MAKTREELLNLLNAENGLEKYYLSEDTQAENH